MDEDEEESRGDVGGGNEPAGSEGVGFDGGFGEPVAHPDEDADDGAGYYVHYRVLQ